MSEQLQMKRWEALTPNAIAPDFSTTTGTGGSARVGHTPGSRAASLAGSGTRRA